MPHLYLPSEHTDADLVLAADVAAAVFSADLYVSWTIDSGHGAPEIEAVVREETVTPPGNAFSDLILALAQGVGALWRSITGPPAQRVAPAQLSEGTGRPASEPSL
jgi:hypothetical protein